MSVAVRRALPMMVVVAATVVTGCAASVKGAVGVRYAAAPTLAAMVRAGWSAKPVAGMADTVTGVRQVAYLATTDPTGDPIDLQFLETMADATKEAQGVEHKYPQFKLQVIGNVLVFSRPDGNTAVPAPALTNLTATLRP